MAANNIEANIKTKNELFHILAFYKAYLTQEAIEYLNSLINMEFCVLEDNKVSYYDRRQLSGTMIFREVTIYNIINYLYPIFENEGFVTENLTRHYTIYKKMDKTTLDILNFYYDIETKDDSFATLSITHYQGYNIYEIKRIEDEINKLKDRREKYRSFSSTYETISYNAKLQELKDRLEEMSKLPNDNSKLEKIKTLNSIEEMICHRLSLIPSQEDEKNVVILKKTPGITVEQHNQRV